MAATSELDHVYRADLFSACLFACWMQQARMHVSAANRPSLCKGMVGPLYKIIYIYIYTYIYHREQLNFAQVRPKVQPTADATLMMA